MAEQTPEEIAKAANEALQATVDRLTGEGQKYHKRAQDAEAANLALTARLDKIEADRKTATDAAEQKDRLSKGQYEEDLAAQKTSMQALIDTQSARGDSAESRLKKIYGIDALKTSLGNQKVKSELIDQVAGILASQVEVSLVDGKISVTVKDAEGNAAFVDGVAMTPDQLVEAFLPENKHFLPPSGDGGTGLHQGGSPGENAGLTQAGLLANPQKHADFIAQYKTSAESSAAFAKLPPKKVE